MEGEAHEGESLLDVKKGFERRSIMDDQKVTGFTTREKCVDAINAHLKKHYPKSTLVYNQTYGKWEEDDGVDWISIKEVHVE